MSRELLNPSAKPRVGIVAFTAQPGLGSEYEVGWQWALLGAQIARAWVLTRRACWEAIPGRSRRWRGWRIKYAEGAVWIAIDLPGAPRWFPGRRLMRTHYLLWQILVWAWLRRNQRGFAFVHHLTFVAAWFPPFAAFSGLPLVWGPIGTNPPIPRFYRGRLRLAARMKAAVRTLVTQGMVRWNPLLPLVARRTNSAFAISNHVRELLPEAMRARVLVHPAIALEPSWLDLTERAKRHSATLLFVGRGMDIKLPRLSVDVARQVIARRPAASAILIGEGLPQLLENEPTGDRLTVRSEIPQAELRELYADCTLFLFPSVEASGFVTLEALAAGLPVACLEGTGAAYFSGPDNPLSVSADGDWDTVRDALVERIVSYLDNPETHAALARQARARAAEFTWAGYRPFLKTLYEAVAQPAKSQPGAINAPPLA